MRRGRLEQTLVVVLVQLERRCPQVPAQIGHVVILRGAQLRPIATIERRARILGKTVCKLDVADVRTLKAHSGSTAAKSQWAPFPSVLSELRYQQCAVLSD